MSKAKKPKFSVVIPLAPWRNAEVLESLKKINYPKKKFEIIVEKGTNPSENRNKGAEKARGEIIAFLDDDAFLPANLLEQAEDFFSKYKGIDIVGGPQLTPSSDKFFAKTSGYALASLFGGFSLRNRYRKGNLNLEADETLLTSANLFCKKNIFKKIKFEPKLFPGEDPDFISKAKKNSFKVAYSPDLVVFHRRRANLRGLAKQIFSYGKTRPKKESFSTTMKMPFFLIPSLFLIYLAFLVIFLASNITLTGNIININPENSTRPLLYIAITSPFLVYIILNLFFSLFIALKEKNLLSVIALPMIFLTIHLSYGTGFLAGIFSKAKVHKDKV